jgi:hypothetical protein
MAQVYSVNAVGYVNVTLKKGYNLVANPLSVGANKLSDIFPATSNLPDDSTVVIWDAAAGTIGGFEANTPIFFQGVGWIPDGEAVLPPGKAFYLQIAATAPNPEYTVTFVGEVMQGSLSNPVAVGNRYSALASQVPQAGKVTTDLGLAGAADDTIFVWDKATGGFASKTYLFIEGSGWFDGADFAEPVIGVGDGFFLQRAAGPTAWTRTFSVNQ